MGSCMILLLTLGFGPVLPLRSGEPTAHGTGDPKRVRCPIIGSCMILNTTTHPHTWIDGLHSGLWGPAKLLDHKFLIDSLTYTLTHTPPW